MLITILTKFRNKGGEVYLMKPSETVQKLLVITKLNAIFHIIQTEEEVLKNAIEHAKQHGIREMTPELKTKVKAAIRDEQ